MTQHEKTILELTNPDHKIVFLTGAGVSTDSGIPDFQELDRTWPFPTPRAEMSSLPFFLQEPELFWEAFWHRLAVEQVQPNIFHDAVAELQKRSGRTRVITQNTDGLHEKAGSQDVLEVHGSIARLVCLPRGCGKHYKTTDFEAGKIPLCPECNNVLKPDVSLFFEGINYMYEARELLLEADYIIVAGTSLRVGPINELPFFAFYQNSQCKQLWVNKENPPEAYDFFSQTWVDSSEFGQQILEALS